MSIWDNYFVFDGVDSRTFGAIAFFNDVDSSPIKEYTTSVIPGRSGDFLLNDRRFANIAQVYDVVIPTNFETNYANLRAFLLSRDGYCRLEDNSHPDEFYHAYFSEQIKPRVSRDRDIGRFQITFTRKPQRWLKSGENAVPIITSGGVESDITNPTSFASFPLLNFKMASSPACKFTINGTQIEITSNSAMGDKYVYIDLETLQCYGRSGATSGAFTYYNQYVKYTVPNDHNKAFKLSPGVNDITYSDRGGISTLSITPRWYTV